MKCRDNAGAGPRIVGDLFQKPGAGGKKAVAQSYEVNSIGGAHGAGRTWR